MMQEVTIVKTSYPIYTADIYEYSAKHPYLDLWPSGILYTTVVRGRIIIRLWSRARKRLANSSIWQ